MSEDERLELLGSITEAHAALACATMAHGELSRPATAPCSAYCVVGAVSAIHAIH